VASNERECGAGFTGQSPWAARRSVWHTPHASVFTRISPAPREGMYISRSSKGFLNCSTNKFNIPLSQTEIKSEERAWFPKLCNSDQFFNHSTVIFE
jgi:hypothetical protein